MPKELNKHMKNLIANTPTHRLHRIAEDRAPTKARNDRKALLCFPKIMSASLFFFNGEGK